VGEHFPLTTRGARSSLLTVVYIALASLALAQCLSQARGIMFMAALPEQSSVL